VKVLRRDDNGRGRGSRRSVLISVGAVVVLVGAVALWWGAQESVEATTTEPAVLEPIEGTSLMRVRLTKRAAERIDLRTNRLRTVLRTQQKVVPYSAVLYDTDGQTWVYTSSEPLAFVRAPVEVDRFEGRLAFLSEGPPAGTVVVSVGAPLLLGAEFGVDH
jgi:hypothetical protein